MLSQKSTMKTKLENSTCRKGSVTVIEKSLTGCCCQECFYYCNRHLFANMMNYVNNVNAADPGSKNMQN